MPSSFFNLFTLNFFLLQIERAPMELIVTQYFGNNELVLLTVSLKDLCFMLLGEEPFSSLLEI